jgi:hypothetical protein
MREICKSGSEGGGAELNGSPYPYPDEGGGQRPVLRDSLNGAPAWLGQPDPDRLKNPQQFIDARPVREVARGGKRGARRVKGR